MLATWNIANLGVQDRLESDYVLIAEMIGWFDLVAVQEPARGDRIYDALIALGLEVPLLVRPGSVDAMPSAVGRLHSRIAQFLDAPDDSVTKVAKSF